MDLKSTDLKSRWSETSATARPIADGPFAGRISKRGEGRKTAAPTVKPNRIDWENVVRLAELMARQIPPASEADRRQWLKYAAIADRHFSEHWLLDSVEAVLNALEHHGRPQAHLVAVLKAKAASESIDLVSMARGIEIPARIWHANVLVIQHWSEREKPRRAR